MASGGLCAACDATFFASLSRTQGMSLIQWLVTCSFLVAHGAFSLLLEISTLITWSDALTGDLARMLHVAIIDAIQ